MELDTSLCLMHRNPAYKVTTHMLYKPSQHLRVIQAMGLQNGIRVRLPPSVWKTHPTTSGYRIAGNFRKCNFSQKPMQWL